MVGTNCVLTPTEATVFMHIQSITCPNQDFRIVVHLLCRVTLEDIYDLVYY